MTANTSNNILRSILDKEKLSGTNFLDWHRNLRIVLKHNRKLYVLETPVPEEEPPSSAPKAERDAYKKHVDDANETACLMLDVMNSELQKQHENMTAFDMIEHMKMLYQEQARHERFEVSKTLFLRQVSWGSPYKSPCAQDDWVYGKAWKVGFSPRKGTCDWFGLAIVAR